MNNNPFSETFDDEHRESAEGFVLDLGGFEGPLHLLLNLARSQKVDLRRISLVDLCNQYFDFLSEAKTLRVEIAADYLIMAAWLIFLKSELLLPTAPLDEENNAEEMSQNLKLQLLRLDAFRKVSVKLMSSDQLDRDFFSRGEKDVLKTSKEIVYTASLLEMLQAYARLKTKEDFEPLHLNRPFILSIDEALKGINKKLKDFVDWQKLEEFVPRLWKNNSQRKRAATATNFSVFLELARLQKVEIMQADLFSPLYLRGINNNFK